MIPFMTHVEEVHVQPSLVLQLRKCFDKMLLRVGFSCINQVEYHTNLILGDVMLHSFLIVRIE